MVSPYTEINHDADRERIKQLIETRQEHLEMMAAAYLKATGIAAIDTVLVEQTVGTMTRWWFEKRTTKEVQC